MLLLRHGQSHFNLHFTATRQDPGIEDPELTALGHEQAQQAAKALEGHTIKRIIISPYTRALQTAEPFLCRPGIKVDILPQVRERTAFSCDIGSSITALSTRFPHHDFSHLPAQWWGETKESEAETIGRARDFQSLMRQRADESQTLLVSHWGFIMALTGQSLGNGTWLPFDPAQPAPAQIIWRP